MAFLLAATLVVALVRVGLADDGPPATKKKPGRTPVTQVRSGAPASAKRLYTVRAGDTLSTIAARTGVSVMRLRQLNPSAEPTSLFIGDKIRLR